MDHHYVIQFKHDTNKKGVKRFKLTWSSKAKTIEEKLYDLRQDDSIQRHGTRKCYHKMKLDTHWRTVRKCGFLGALSYAKYVKH